MIFRPFQPQDLEPILTLFHYVVHSTGAKYYTEEQLNAWASKENLPDKNKWLQSLSANITWVAIFEGKIIGFADMTQLGHIERCYVHPHFQGQGVARGLMGKLEQEARMLGLKELTADASQIAMPLLRRIGFNVVRKYSKVHKGIEFTNFWMKKLL